MEAWLHEAYGWVVTVWAQEFFRQDPLGDELRQTVARALESVAGVADVAEHDNESWRVTGTPSGEALTRAAANGWIAALKHDPLFALWFAHAYAGVDPA